jgi:hypothetical protein
MPVVPGQSDMPGLSSAPGDFAERWAPLSDPLESSSRGQIYPPKLAPGPRALSAPDLCGAASGEPAAPPDRLASAAGCTQRLGLPPWAGTAAAPYAAPAQSCTGPRAAAAAGGTAAPCGGPVPPDIGAHHQQGHSLDAMAFGRSDVEPCRALPWDVCPAKAWAK